MKSKEKIEIIKNSKGITLIALVVTIIVIIILAGVSINLVLGDNGILTKAKEAKEEYQEAELKEKLQLAIIAARIENSNYEGVNKEKLQAELYKQFGEGNVYATENGNHSFLIKINNKEQREYLVKSNGEIREVKYDKWNGKVTEPTEKTSTGIHIYTASELKWLEEEVNSGNTFSGYTIYLENDLDFLATPNNGNWEITENEELRWNPIGKVKDNCLLATFEGNNHIIQGIYVNDDSYFNGIFGNSSTIVNLTIKDSYIKGQSCTGGIVGALREGKIENCHNINTIVTLKEGDFQSIGGIVGQQKGDVTKCTNSGTVIANGKLAVDNGSYCGGIVGLQLKSNFTIDECQNDGEIISKGAFTGGIVGYSNDMSTVKNCLNTGNVKCEQICVGGIVGYGYTSVKIENCRNTAIVQGTSYCGGINGYINTLSTIKYCYNKGEVIGSEIYIGGISGFLYTLNNDIIITRCYNKGNIVAESTLGMILGAGKVSQESVHNYYLKINDIGAVDRIDYEEYYTMYTNDDIDSYEEFLIWIDKQ